MSERVLNSDEVPTIRVREFDIKIQGQFRLSKGA